MSFFSPMDCHVNGENCHLLNRPCHEKRTGRTVFWTTEMVIEPESSSHDGNESLKLPSSDATGYKTSLKDPQRAGGAGVEPILRSGLASLVMS